MKSSIKQVISNILLFIVFFVLSFILTAAVMMFDYWVKSKRAPNTEEIVQPEFLTSNNPKEDLLTAMDYYGVQHPKIVYAQAILETGHFKSRVCKEYNNLFGLYNSHTKDFYKFNHWTESVVAYINYVQYKYSPHDDYYQFLADIGYAEDPEYVNKLKRIVNQYDKERTADKVCITD